MSAEERFLSLQVVADCFEVRVAWLEEVYETGLLGPAVRRKETVELAASELDLVAQIIRLHFHQGVDLQGIALLFAHRR